MRGTKIYKLWIEKGAQIQNEDSEVIMQVWKPKKWTIP